MIGRGSAVNKYKGCQAMQRTYLKSGSLSFWCSHLDDINVDGGIMHPGSRTEHSKSVLRNRQLSEEEKRRYSNMLVKVLLDH